MIQIVGAITQNIHIINIPEYLSNQDLGSYLQNKERLQPLKIVRVTLDIAREINYLHKSKLKEPLLFTQNEDRRPRFKFKPKNYPSDLKELIQ
jgi:hypothetical protein